MSWLTKLYPEDDENSYFELGHGDHSHEHGYAPDYLIWVLLDGQIKTSPIYSTSILHRIEKTQVPLMA